MTQDEIIEMAKEAGLEVDGYFQHDHIPLYTRKNSWAYAN